jgi:hypothetical protein
MNGAGALAATRHCIWQGCGQIGNPRPATREQIGHTLTRALEYEIAEITLRPPRSRIKRLAELAR